MEEKLIVCVAAYPVLFDASLFSYLDVNKKNDAWRRVADDVGVPAEVCKETFKYLLDSYKREKNREKELSRCGAGLTNHKPWKYAALMGFLAPFLEVEQTARQPDSEPESPASEARASTVSQATLSSQTPASSGRKRVLILVALKRAQAPASQPTPQAEDEDYLF